MSFTKKFVFRHVNFRAGYFKIVSHYAVTWRYYAQRAKRMAQSSIFSPTVGWARFSSCVLKNAYKTKGG